MMELRVAESGTVHLNDVRYIQSRNVDLGPIPNGDPCYWCSAYRNMRLCNVICPYCKICYVFVRK